MSKMAKVLKVTRVVDGEVITDQVDLKINGEKFSFKKVDNIECAENFLYTDEKGWVQDNQLDDSELEEMVVKVINTLQEEGFTEGQEVDIDELEDGFC